MNTVTIDALVQATPTVVYRIMSLCRRYRVQIESVTVSRTDQAGVSRVTLVVGGAPTTPLIAQLRKLVDVHEVSLNESKNLSGRRHVPAVSEDTTSSLPSPSHSAQADGAF